MNWLRRKKKDAVDFKNVASVCALGHSHRSKLEGAVCQLLQLRERAGELKLEQIEDHVAVCGPPGHECPKKREYVADFRCLDLKSGELFWVEAKGFANERWPTTKTLWKHYGPGRLEVWQGDHRRPKLVEVIRSIQQQEREK